MLTKIFSSSTQSFNIEADSASVRQLVEAKSPIQYFVLEAYFKAMHIFDTKSSVICAGDETILSQKTDYVNKKLAKICLLSL